MATKIQSLGKRGGSVGFPETRHFFFLLALPKTVVFKCLLNIYDAYVYKIVTQ